MERINLKRFYKESKAKFDFARTVANRCDVSMNAVLKWCNFDGKTKDESKLKVLSEETGIPVEDLFNRELN